MTVKRYFHLVTANPDKLNKLCAQQCFLEFVYDDYT